MSKFKELYGETLKGLSKDELISIIEIYHSCSFKISEVCVDESKSNIDSKSAIGQVRDYLRKVNLNFYNEELLRNQIRLYNEKQ